MKINYLPLWKTISTSAQKLRVIKEWGARTKTPKKEAHKLVIDSELADVSSEDNDEKKDTGRRLRDTIISNDLNSKLNLDRRIAHSDRRANTNPHYNGPSRRYTIERRRNLKDRRDNR